MRKKLIRIVYAVLICGFLLMRPFPSYAAKVTTGKANVMRLEKAIGDISVKSSSGANSQIIDKMRLTSGDEVQSLASSYAYISLDDSKVVKMDSKSGAVVEKNSNKYEAVLEYGNLFFDVEKPLSSNESFEIKTSNVTMGIRGTCAQIENPNANVTSICLLDGTLACTVTDPLTGNSQSTVLNAGEYALFCTGEGYMNSCQIIKRRAMVSDVRGFTLQYIIENDGIAQKIFDQTGLDFRNLLQPQVDYRLALDEGGKTVTVNAGRTSPTAAWYASGH